MDEIAFLLQFVPPSFAPSRPAHFSLKSPKNKPPLALVLSPNNKLVRPGIAMGSSEAVEELQAESQELGVVMSRY